MEDQAIAEMLRFVQIIPDPRRHNVSHPLTSIILIAILAVMCGEDDWTDVQDWADFNLDWLKTFLDLPHGIPSHDTLQLSVAKSSLTLRQIYADAPGRERYFQNRCGPN